MQSNRVSARDIRVLLCVRLVVLAAVQKTDRNHFCAQPGRYPARYSSRTYVYHHWCCEKHPEPRFTHVQPVPIEADVGCWQQLAESRAVMCESERDVHDEQREVPLASSAWLSSAFLAGAFTASGCLVIETRAVDETCNMSDDGVLCRQNPGKSKA